MKKTILIAGALALGLTLGGCGDAQQTPPTQEPTQAPTLATAPTSPPATPAEAVPMNDLILQSSAEAVAELTPLKQDYYDNGTYYHMSATEDRQVRMINSCYQNNRRSNETQEQYLQRRAVGLSAALTPGNPYGLEITEDQELSDGLGYPVHQVSFFTGSDLDAACWTVYLTQTEHYSYQYAFCTTPEQMDLLEEAITEYFTTLKLEPLEA